MRLFTDSVHKHAATSWGRSLVVRDEAQSNGIHVRLHEKKRECRPSTHWPGKTSMCSGTKFQVSIFKSFLQTMFYVRSEFLLFTYRRLLCLFRHFLIIFPDSYYQRLLFLPLRRVTKILISLQSKSSIMNTWRNLFFKNCMKRLDYFLQKNVDLTAQDRLGNTALMYAAIYGHSKIVNLLVDELTRRWSFDVFRVKNCMGHTAESLARKNGRVECAK